MLTTMLQALANPGRPDPIERSTTPQVLGQAFCQLIERYPADRLPTTGGVNATVVVTLSLETLLGRRTPPPAVVNRRPHHRGQRRPHLPPPSHPGPRQPPHRDPARHRQAQVHPQDVSRAELSAPRPNLGRMTSLDNRPNTALVVIDMQNGVVGSAFERDRVIANIQTLVDRARAEQVPLLWVQHSSEELPIGSDVWDYVPELKHLDDEPVIHKTYGDSFEATDLEERLAKQGVGRLVVTGAQTEACVRATLHGALVRGYDVDLVSDAHTTEDLRQWGLPVSPEQSIAFTNMYWSWAEAPGRKGSVMPTAEVQFANR
jgi:hypothetical protein